MQAIPIEKQPEHWSSLGLYEYLLVANPDAGVNSKIMQEKQFFYEEYKQKIAVKTMPHITVANYLAKEEMEETISRYLQRICNHQQSFNVSLNNYSGFPPHTIYLRVQNAHPFKQLAKELKPVSDYVSSCSCPPVRLITNPHVTIARRLPETVYIKALMDFGQRSFYETFTVNELVLLRRANQFDTCKMVNVFSLQPPGRTLFN